MTDQPTPDHRALAVALFNSVWDLLEKADRTGADDLLMLHRAHASLWHWLQVGTDVHHQRGAWMVARIYAELGWMQPACAFADQARKLLAKTPAAFQDFDHAFLVALDARIAAGAGDHAAAHALVLEARRLGAVLETEDQAVFFDQLKAGAWHGFGPPRIETTP